MTMPRFTFVALPFVVALAALPAARAQDAPALLQKHDCQLCHATDEARTGPSYVEIAERYRGDPKARAKLVAVVRKGEHGGSPWPMPPLPQVSEADARKMIDYILAMRQ